MAKYTVGQHVNAIILEHNNDGILVKLENDNLTAFIPGKLISKDYFIEENGKLECLIQEIDENKRMITLAIVQYGIRYKSTERDMAKAY